MRCLCQSDLRGNVSGLPSLVVTHRSSPTPLTHSLFQSGARPPISEAGCNPDSPASRRSSWVGHRLPTLEHRLSHLLTRLQATPRVTRVRQNAEVRGDTTHPQRTTTAPGVSSRSRRTASTPRALIPGNERRRKPGE